MNLNFVCLTSLFLTIWLFLLLHLLFCVCFVFYFVFGSVFLSSLLFFRGGTCFEEGEGCDRDRSPRILTSECTSGLAGDLNLDSFGFWCACLSHRLLYSTCTATYSSTQTRRPERVRSVPVSYDLGTLVDITIGTGYPRPGITLVHWYAVRVNLRDCTSPSKERSQR